MRKILLTVFLAVAVVVVAGFTSITKAYDVRTGERPTLGGALACNLSIGNASVGGYLVVNQTGGEMMHGPFGEMYLNNQLTNPAASGAWPNFRFHFPEMKNGDAFKYQMSDVSGSKVWCNPITAVIPTISCKVKDSKGNDTDYKNYSFYINKPIVFEVSVSGGSGSFSYSWRKDGEKNYTGGFNSSPNLFSSFIITSFNTSGLHSLYAMVKDEKSLINSYTNCYARVKEVELPTLVNPPDAAWFGKINGVKWNGEIFIEYPFELVAKAPAGAGNSPVVFVIDSGAKYITGTLMQESAGGDGNYHLSLSDPRLNDLKEGNSSPHSWAAQVPNAMSEARSFYIDKTAPNCNLIMGHITDQNLNNRTVQYDTSFDVYMSDNSGGVGVNGGLSELYLKEVNTSEIRIPFTFANWVKDFKISDFNPLKIYATGVKEGNQYRLTVKDVLKNEFSCSSAVVKIPPPNCVTNPGAPGCPPIVKAPVITGVKAVFPKSPSVGLPKINGRWAAPAWMKVRVKAEVTGADSCIIGGIGATKESGGFYADVSMPSVAPITISATCNNAGGSAIKTASMYLIGQTAIRMRAVLESDVNTGVSGVDIYIGDENFIGTTNASGFIDLSPFPFEAWRAYVIDTIAPSGYSIIDPSFFDYQITGIECKKNLAICNAILDEEAENLSLYFSKKFENNDLASDTGFVFKLRKITKYAQLDALTATSEVTSGGTINVSWTGSNLPSSCAASANPALGGWNNSVLSGSGSGNFSFTAPDVTQETTYWLGLDCSGGDASNTKGKIKTVDGPSVKVKPKVELPEVVVPVVELITLTATPSEVTSGDLIVVNWTGNDLPRKCKSSSSPALDGWNESVVSGEKTGNVNPFFLIAPSVTVDMVYKLGLDCRGEDVSNAKAVKEWRVGPSVKVKPKVVAKKPEVILQVSVLGGTASDGPITVNAGDNVKLTWSSTNAVSCTTSGGTGTDGWMTNKVERTTGANNSLGNSIKVDSAQTFTLTCKNASDLEAKDSVTVNVIPKGQQSFMIISNQDPNIDVTDKSVIEGIKTKFSVDTNGNSGCVIKGDIKNFSFGGVIGKGKSQFFSFPVGGPYKFTYSCTSGGVPVSHTLTVKGRDYVDIRVHVSDSKGDPILGKSVLIDGGGKTETYPGFRIYTTNSDGDIPLVNSKDLNGLKRGDILNQVSLLGIDQKNNFVVADGSRVGNASYYISQVLGASCGGENPEDDCNSFYGFWSPASNESKAIKTNVKENDLSEDYYSFVISDVPPVTAGCSVTPANVEKEGVATATVSAIGGSESYTFNWPNLSVEGTSGSYHSQASVLGAVSYRSMSFSTAGAKSFVVTIKDQNNINLGALAGCSVNVTESLVVPPPGVNCASIPIPTGCPGAPPVVQLPNPNIQVGVVDVTSGVSVPWGSSYPLVAVTVSGINGKDTFGGSGSGDGGVSSPKPFITNTSFNVNIVLSPEAVAAGYTISSPASGSFNSAGLAKGENGVYIFELKTNQPVVLPPPPAEHPVEQPRRWVWNDDNNDYDLMEGNLVVSPSPDSDNSKPCDGLHKKHKDCLDGFTGTGADYECQEAVGGKWEWVVIKNDCTQKLNCLLSEKAKKMVNLVFKQTWITFSDYFGEECSAGPFSLSCVSDSVTVNVSMETNTNIKGQPDDSSVCKVIFNGNVNYAETIFDGINVTIIKPIPKEVVQ